MLFIILEIKQKQNQYFNKNICMRISTFSKINKEISEKSGNWILTSALYFLQHVF